MSARVKSSKMLPRDDWSRFLEAFSLRRHGWLVRLETHDLVTREKAMSQETPLDSIELDLEDEKNPRINITVHSGNKVIKHILFLPSQLVLQSSNDDREQSLQVETVNTETTIHLRMPAPLT